MFSCHVLALSFRLKVAEGIQHSRIQALHTNQQCTIKYTAKYTYLMSRHAEVTRYYSEFPECQEIKCMHNQWMPGPLLRFLNGPGDTQVYCRYPPHHMWVNLSLHVQICYLTCDLYCIRSDCCWLPTMCLRL